MFVAQQSNNFQLEKQLDYANDKVMGLQKMIEQKTSELSQQYEKTGRLMSELADKDKKEKMVSCFQNLYNSFDFKFHST